MGAMGGNPDSFWQVFSSLDARTTRIEFEVPKTDFEKLGWDATHVPLSIPADPNPDVPLKLRGWYIKGDGVSADDEGGSDSDSAEGRVENPLMILSSTRAILRACRAPDT